MNVRSCAVAVVLFLVVLAEIQAFLPASFTAGGARRSSVRASSNSNDGTDWKAWYHEETAKYSALKQALEQNTELQLEKLRGKIDIATEETKLVQTELKLAETEIKELQALLAADRQRHVEEFRDLQGQLQAQERVHVRDRIQGVEQLKRLEQLHSRKVAQLQREFDAQTQKLQAEWSQKLEKQQVAFHDLQAQHQTTLRVLDQTADTVRVLEQEKHSLRSLCLNGLRLLKLRAGKRLNGIKLFLFRAPASPKQQLSEEKRRSRKFSSAVVTYEEEFEDAFQ